ncbi:hypothetical protein COCCADRAFT_84777, partial [Bipolaris zeicola 26-R-13]
PQPTQPSQKKKVKKKQQESRLVVFLGRYWVSPLYRAELNCFPTPIRTKLFQTEGECSSWKDFRRENPPRSQILEEAGVEP